MKLVSWNVNGLRACMKKGFAEFLAFTDADIFAVQETKMKPEQSTFTFKGYHLYWNSADKPGYSGTLVLTKHAPMVVTYGIDGVGYNDEGRVITLEFEDYFFVTAYVPNAQRALTRLEYRMTFEDEFSAYLSRLDAKKPVILCGDLNVAHTPIDLKNPKANENNAGFTLEERTKFTTLLNAGFKDTFRSLYPEKIQYTWWSYMFNARKNNVGWRIDYFVVSERILPQVNDSLIHDSVQGSDHCPVELRLDL